MPLLVVLLSTDCIAQYVVSLQQLLKSGVLMLYRVWLLVRMQHQRLAAVCSANVRSGGGWWHAQDSIVVE